MGAHDIVIIGGGVVAHAVSWACARAGATVGVIHDDGPTASAAAAGMLAPSFEAHHGAAVPELGPLLAQALEVWDDFHTALWDQTGHIIDYQRSGIVGLDTALRGGETPCAVPAGLGAKAAGRVSGEGQVDPRKLVGALRAASVAAGVHFYPGVATGTLWDGSRAVGVQCADGTRVSAGAVVIAAGAQSADLAPDLPPLIGVRGRAFQVDWRAPPFVDVVRTAQVYLCPKADGTLYVGATEEGVVQRTDADIDALWDRAVTLCPELGARQVVGMFDGVRPVPAAGMPAIGPASGKTGLFLAYGHGRNGVLLAPMTGQRIVAALGL